MKIRTLEQLTLTLDEDLVWRKKEISLLKSFVTKKFNNSQEDAHTRSLVVITYAHWEGFIKNSSQAYLNYVSMRKLPYAHLSINMLSIAIRKILGRAFQSKKLEDHIELVDFFDSKMQEKFSDNVENSINTKSNLSSDVFFEILLSVGIDKSKFEGKKNLIDEKLLKSRNSIAHGSELLISQEDAISTSETIIQMLDLFKTEILDAAQFKLYMNSKARE